MKIIPKKNGYKLPINPEKKQGKISQGFVTPKQDKNPQVQKIPPKRVLPIVFIPGIMGSNLRMTETRQKEINGTHNISWRPDNSSVTVAQYNDSPIERQLRLDPENTEVDTYDPLKNPTGNLEESSDSRNQSVTYTRGYRGWNRLDGPLLQPDLPGTKNRRNQDQKARERGWGEIYFGSYQKVLEVCESKLNSAFSGGTMDLYLQTNILKIDPKKWQADPSIIMLPLDESSMRDAVKGCWFPVHAMGYNWLKGNFESGVVIAKKINTLIDKYKSEGFECEKVILITHSMGGIVARAVIHPAIGNANDKILGVVHAVMPAMGAGAAYKRMRCGVEGEWTAPTERITAGVLGDNAQDVTAVLANAQGALELLPNQFYGAHWLEFRDEKKILKSWPAQCPYEEIYKVRAKWFSLFRERWINPANAIGVGIQKTLNLLDDAKSFHAKIENTYHDQSYAHYGVDPDRKAWHKVTWKVDDVVDSKNIDSLKIVEDNRKGSLSLVDLKAPEDVRKVNFLSVEMLGPDAPGDQTVPSHSADAQLLSRKFKGVFRQQGYEHQGSYSNPVVLASTLYCLFKIISTMKWEK